jgi:3-oxoadipate enol-lactonase
MNPSAHILNRLGCPIHYWLAGSAEGPLVVLVHGALANHQQLQPQFDALAAHFRVLTLDLRGHGLSQPEGEPFSLACAVDDIAAILERCRPTCVIGIGLSMGGLIVQQLAARYPRLMQALAIIGAPSVVLALPRWEQIYLALFCRLMSRLPRPLARRLVARFSGCTRATRRHALWAMRQTSQRTSQHVWTSLAAAYSAQHNGKSQQWLPQTVLLACGSADRCSVSHWHMSHWAKSHGACYVAIPRAGHVATLDRPNLVAGMLLRFCWQQCQTNASAIPVACDQTFTSQVTGEPYVPS